MMMTVGNWSSWYTLHDIWTVTLSRVYSVWRSGLCLQASITTTWLWSLIDISIDTHDTYDDNDNDDDMNWSTTTLGLWWLHCQLHLETWDLMWYYTLCLSQSTLYTCCCCCCWWWCWWWWWWFDTGYNGHGSAVMLVLLLILVIMTDSGSQ